LFMFANDELLFGQDTSYFLPIMLRRCVVFKQGDNCGNYLIYFRLLGKLLKLAGFEKHFFSAKTAYKCNETTLLLFYFGQV
jgi:hypothetical protein